MAGKATFGRQTAMVSPQIQIRILRDKHGFNSKGGYTSHDNRGWTTISKSSM